MADRDYFFNNFRDECLSLANKRPINHACRAQIAAFGLHQFLHAFDRLVAAHPRDRKCLRDKPSQELPFG